MTEESASVDGMERTLQLLAELRSEVEAAGMSRSTELLDELHQLIAQPDQRPQSSPDPSSSLPPAATTDLGGTASVGPGEMEASAKVTAWSAPTFASTQDVVSAPTLKPGPREPSSPTPAPRIHADTTPLPASPTPSTAPSSPTANAGKATSPPAPPVKVRPPPPPPPPPKPLRLPNGNANREYSARLDSLIKIPVDRLEYLGVWPPGLTLGADGVLSGMPQTAGEYSIPWRRLGVSSTEGEFLLTINPDPRSLWKNLPSDRSDPFWKPDADQRQASSPSAHVAAASVRGRSHAHVGSYRDDDFGMYLPDGDDPFGWHLICVADGAGGSKSSRRGSQVACAVVIEKLRDLLVESPADLAAELDLRSRDASIEEKSDGAFWTRTLYHVLGTAAAHAQAAVRKEAETLGTSIKDFSTTLLVAIVRRTSKGAWFVGAYWVGDGAIGMWDDGWTSPKLFGEPESGEFAGQTTFFTSEDFSRAESVQRRLRYTLVEDFGFLALMTDGISDPKFPTEQLLKAPEPWAAFQADIGGVLESLKRGDPGTDAQLLAWMDFWSAGNHDDRTLLLLVPRALDKEID